MAEQHLEDPSKRIWALGTLAELYLLEPLTVPEEQFDSVKSEATKAAIKMVQELLDSDEAFAIESTTRQFERYIQWWPEVQCTAGAKRLKAMATEIRNYLPQL